MANFNVTGFSSDITEGSSLSFTLTPVSALVAGLTVRWEIVLDGKLPASPGFFPALSGTVTFAIGAIGGQPVTIMTNNDAFISEDRSFSIRLIEVADAQTLFNRKVTLIDDDTSRSFANVLISNTGDHDTLVFGSSYTYSSVQGLAGDDTFIITRHQRGDLSINDQLGEHIIKFDENVEITHVDQTIVRIRGRMVIDEIALTLDTGAVITVERPASVGSDGPRYRYQLGDGEAQVYANFYAELTAGDEPFVAGSTSELKTPYAITGGPNALNNGGRDSFTVTNLQDTVEEGNDLSFTLTPVSALDGETTVRWEIVLDGKLPASPGFFPALSGTVTFGEGDGETDGQTVTIMTNNDAFISENRSFSVRLIEVAVDNPEIQIGEDHAVTLIDDDTSRSFANVLISNTGDHDTLVFGSSYTYSSVQGLAGDDTFIITRHQRGDLSINDQLGEHIIKFDEGVEITHVDQTIVRIRGRMVIDEIALTLDTGAVITVERPASVGSDGPRYRYQLGDGEAQVYADFYAELTPGDEPFVVDTSTDPATTTTQLETPYAITGGLPDTGPYYSRWLEKGEMVTMSDNTLGAFTGETGFSIFAVGDDGVRDEGDVFVASGLPGYRKEDNLIILDDRVPDGQRFSFLQGSDVYLIEQGFDALDLTIVDGQGVNIIAFGDNIGVKEITSVHSPSVDGLVQQATLTVDTDTSNTNPNDTVLVTLEFPQESFLFYDTNDHVPVLKDFDTFSAEII